MNGSRIVLSPFSRAWLNGISTRERRQELEDSFNRLILECDGNQNQLLDTDFSRLELFADWVARAVRFGAKGSPPRQVIVVFTNLCLVADLLAWRRELTERLHLVQALWVAFGELEPRSLFVTELQRRGRFEGWLFEGIGVWQQNGEDHRFLVATPSAVQEGKVHSALASYFPQRMSPLPQPLTAPSRPSQSSVRTESRPTAHPPSATSAQPSVPPVPGSVALSPTPSAPPPDAPGAPGGIRWKK